VSRPWVESHFTLVDGVRMRWQVSTAVPRTEVPVVLVHGVGVSSRYLLPTLRTLAPFHRCYAPDLPGFGRSRVKRTRSVDDLVEALGRWWDALGIGPAVVLANSMGCQFATGLAARRPALVRELVLVGPTFDPVAPTLLGQLWRGLRTAPHERASLFPILLWDYLASGARRILATMRDGLRHPIEAVAPRVDAPVLIVRGSEDRIAPERWVRFLANRFPNARTATVPGSAHAVNFSAPLELTRLTRSFVEEAPEPRMSDRAATNVVAARNAPLPAAAGRACPHR
jgi:2-hydroxy-6-oxonona-2,4-dienedioate hydrolase